MPDPCLDIFLNANINPLHTMIMKETYLKGEYLAPEVKVMNIGTRSVLCVSDATAVGGSTEMESVDW